MLVELGVRLGEGVDVGEGELVLDGVREPEWDGVLVEEELGEEVPAPVRVPVGDDVLDLESLDVLLLEGDAVPVGDREELNDRLVDIDPDELPVDDGDGVCVEDLVAVPDGVPEWDDEEVLLEEGDTLDVGELVVVDVLV